MTNRPTVHVIDDDPAMRDSLGFLLDVHGFQPRLHESAGAFLKIMCADRVDCIVTDVRMPEMTGLDLVHRLRTDQISAPIIVMTGHGDIPLAVEAMKAGVVDFIEKPFSNEVLVGAIRTALGGNADQRSERARQEACRRLATLSARERDVLAGVVAGKVNKVIAHELQISPRTVEIYRANVMSKTAARNISELMRIALAAGL